MRNLPRKDRAEVERVMELINAISGKQDNTFAASACWPDDLKRNQVHAMEDWHVIDLAYNPQAIPLNVSNEHVLRSKNNLVNILYDMHATLRQCDGMPDGCSANKTFELSFGLHWVVHLVAEIHSPLHCVTRYTEKNPNGDSHGKLEVVDVDGMRVSLHEYWDGAAGQFDSIQRPLNAQGDAYLQGWVDRLMEEYPPLHYDEFRLHSFQDWAMEGYKLAVEIVYRYEDTMLEEVYQARARNITRQQLALAGYRLSNLLLHFGGIPKHCRAVGCLHGGLCVSMPSMITAVVVAIFLALTAVLFVYSVFERDSAVQRSSPELSEQPSGSPHSLYEDAQERLEDPLLRVRSEAT